MAESLRDAIIGGLLGAATGDALGATVEFRCIDSCIAYNEMAAALLEGVHPSEAIARAQALDLHSGVQGALEIPAYRSVTSLSTKGYVIDSLRCATWAIQQPESFEDVLVALANRGGDADTAAAIAGGLLGIIHGEAAIPSRWKDRLEYAPRIVEAAAHVEPSRICGERGGLRVPE